MQAPQNTPAGEEVDNKMDDKQVERSNDQPESNATIVADVEKTKEPVSTVYPDIPYVNRTLP
jgi:hypothetical protein